MAAFTCKREHENRKFDYETNSATGQDHLIEFTENIGLQLFCPIGTNTKIEVRVIFIRFKSL
jgi:hypothetical protein